MTEILWWFKIYWSALFGAGIGFYLLAAAVATLWSKDSKATELNLLWSEWPWRT